MLRPAAFLVLVAGCGRIGFDGAPFDGLVGGTPIALVLPWGGRFDHLAVAPDGTWYAMASNHGTFRSDDQLTWVACGDAGSSPYITGLAVASDGSVYTSGSDIMVSHDRCATFQPTGLTRYSDGVASFGTKLYGLADNGLKTRTAGLWTAVPTALDGDRFISFDAVAGGSQFAGTVANGLVVTPNGTTWTPITSGLPTLNIQDLAAGTTKTYAMCGGTNAGIACSDATGAVWSPCYTGGGEAIAVDPADPLHVVAAPYDDLVVTTDGFTTSMAGQRTLPMDRARIHAVRFAGPGMTLVAGDRGVYLGNGVPLVWQPRLTGLSAWSVSQIVLAGEDAYLATAGGVLHARAGLPFTVDTTGMPHDSRVDSVVVTPDGTLLAAGRDINASADHGQTWTNLVSLNTADAFSSNAIVLDGVHAYVGTDTRILTADPPYTTWTPHAFEAAHSARSLLVTGGVLWVGTDAGLYRSTDGGATLTAVSSLAPAILHTIVQLADGSLLVGTDNGVSHSDQAQTTWTSAGLAGIEVDQLLVSGGAIVAASKSGAQTTRDVGTTWTPVPGANMVSALSLIVEPATGQLLVGTRGFGVLRVPIP